jgi:hypothetical protein
MEDGDRPRPAAEIADGASDLGVTDLRLLVKGRRAR